MGWKPVVAKAGDLRAHGRIFPFDWILAASFRVARICDVSTSSFVSTAEVTVVAPSTLGSFYRRGVAPMRDVAAIDNVILIDDAEVITALTIRRQNSETLDGCLVGYWLKSKGLRWRRATSLRNIPARRKTIPGEQNILTLSNIR